MTEEQYKKALSEIDETIKRIIENPEKEDIDYLKFREEIISDINLDRAWLKLHYKRGRKFLYFSSAAAAIAALFISLLIFSPDQANNSNEILASEEILPAEGAVTVRLSSGKIVELISDENNNEFSEGVVINRDGGEISYEGIVSKESVQGIENKDLKVLEYNELATPKGKSYSIILSDGSKVWLNAQSAIKYPVRFGANERVIQISGEAYFEIKYDSQRPFIVQAPDYNVKVLGTKFNINAYSNERISTTTLVSGSVAIPTASGSETLLSPGEQMKFSKTDKAVSVEKVDVELYTSWIDNNLRIEQMSLEDIFTILMRRYDINVYYVNDITKAEKFSGKIPLNDNLRVVLEQISKVSDVEFQYEKNLVVVKSKKI